MSAESNRLRSQARFLANPHERAAMEAAADLLDGFEAEPDTRPDWLRRGNDRGVGTEIQCPACAAMGMDNKGNHLLVYNDLIGIACALFPKIDGLSYPERDEHLSDARARLKLPDPKPYDGPDLSEERAAKKAAAITLRESIFEEFQGTLADLGPSGPLPIGQENADLICAAYQPGDVAWFGTRFDLTDEGVAKRQRKIDAGVWVHPGKPFLFKEHLFDPTDPKARAKAFANAQAKMLDHAFVLAFHAEATGRSDDDWFAVRSRIVEHDGTKTHPTPMRFQIACIRYAKEVLGWDLRYVLSTGSVKPEGGIHGSFDVGAISPEQLAEDIAELTAIGVDSKGLTHAHTRTPGVHRRKCDKNAGGLIQHVLWTAPN